MTEKQIAVLMAQPDEPYQQELIRGMLEKAEEFNCRITVFSMYIKYQNNEEHIGFSWWNNSDISEQ